MNIKEIWVGFDLHPVMFTFVFGTLVYGLGMSIYLTIYPAHPVAGVLTGYLVGFNMSLLFTQWQLVQSRKRAEKHIGVVKEAFEAYVTACREAESRGGNEPPVPPVLQ